MLRYFLLAILSGLLLALSFPSLGFPLLAFVGFVPLLFAEQLVSYQKKNKGLYKVFLLAFVTFFIFNAKTIWWLHFSLRNDGNYAWEAYLFPVLFNTSLMAITFSIYSWVKEQVGNYLGMFFFILIWICFEKMHLEWEIAFPWLNLGNAFMREYKWIQWYEYTGVLGGTLWVLVVNLMFFYGLMAWRNLADKKILIRQLAIGVGLIVFPVLVSLMMYNGYKENKSLGKVSALALQPNLDPYSKKQEFDGDQILQRLLNLAINDTDVDFIAAPETAFPGTGKMAFNELENDTSVRIIREWQEKNPKPVFVSGVEAIKWFEADSMTKTARAYGNSGIYYDVYNSAVQFEKSKEIKVYHKSKGVPGVEHFPYGNLLKPLVKGLLSKFGGSLNSFAGQKERAVFENQKNKAVVAPIICYESVFGEYVTDYVNKGANVLFILTNDSWWSFSDGHRHLLWLGRLRAIENRRAIVRSANSGVSAFINQRGDILKTLDYQKTGAIKSEVYLNDTITSYAKNGDVIARIALFLAGIIWSFGVVNKIVKKKV